MIKVLEERCSYPSAEMDETWRILRLVKETEDSSVSYRIEVSHVERETEQMKLSFWQRLKWALFSKKRYPVAYCYRTKFQKVFELNDTDPNDPYAQNCAREVWDYLTKDYTTSI